MTHINHKLWTRAMAVFCQGYGILAVVEYFNWFWPTALSHQITTGVLGAIFFFWDLVYFLNWHHRYYKMYIPEFATFVVSSAAIINLWISSARLWWYPPHCGWPHLVMAMCVFSWGTLLQLYLKESGYPVRIDWKKE